MDKCNSRNLTQSFTEERVKPRKMFSILCIHQVRRDALKVSERLSGDRILETQQMWYSRACGKQNGSGLALLESQHTESLVSETHSPASPCSPRWPCRNEWEVWAQIGALCSLKSLLGLPALRVSEKEPRKLKPIPTPPESLQTQPPPGQFSGSSSELTT